MAEYEVDFYGSKIVTANSAQEAKSQFLDESEDNIEYEKVIVRKHESYDETVYLEDSRNIWQCDLYIYIKDSEKDVK